MASEEDIEAEVQRRVAAMTSGRQTPITSPTSLRSSKDAAPFIVEPITYPSLRPNTGFSAPRQIVQRPEGHGSVGRQSPFGT
jgi:hypothetical protein